MKAVACITCFPHPMWMLPTY